MYGQFLLLQQHKTSFKSSEAVSEKKNINVFYFIFCFVKILNNITLKNVHVVANAV